MTENPGHDVVRDPKRAELRGDCAADVVDAEVDAGSALEAAQALLHGREVSGPCRSAREDVGRVPGQDAQSSQDIVHLPRQAEPVLTAALDDEAPFVRRSKLLEGCSEELAPALTSPERELPEGRFARRLVLDCRPQLPDLIVG